MFIDRSEWTWLIRQFIVPEILFFTMESTNNSELFRSTFSITLNLRNLDQSSNEEERITASNENVIENHISSEELNVVHNKQSENIKIPVSQVESVERHLNENLQFLRIDKQNGAIFKSKDGKATVTLYKSTNLLHVQGCGHLTWTKQFCEHYNKLKEENSAESGIVSSN